MQGRIFGKRNTMQRYILNNLFLWYCCKRFVYTMFITESVMKIIYLFIRRFMEFYTRENLPWCYRFFDWTMLQQQHYHAWTVLLPWSNNIVEQWQNNLTRFLNNFVKLFYHCSWLKTGKTCIDRTSVFPVVMLTCLFQLVLTSYYRNDNRTMLYRIIIVILTLWKCM